MESILEYALGTTISITGHGARRAFAEVQRLETILSRFGDTPLVRLNQRGRLEHPPIELLLALEHALRVAAQTRGLITPTVLPALERIGYTESWRSGTAFHDPARLPQPAPTSQGITAHPELIALPAGVRLDLGGTAKTWIAERVSALLEGDFMLDFGGDLYARQHQPFTVRIETPDAAPLGYELPAGTWGICTSSTQRRATGDLHHLIDPRSGRALETKFVQVTVVAARATAAEVIAKLAFFGMDQLTLYARSFETLLAIDANSNLTTTSPFAARSPLETA